MLHSRRVDDMDTMNKNVVEAYLKMIFESSNDNDNFNINKTSVKFNYTGHAGEKIFKGDSSIGASDNFKNAATMKDLVKAIIAAINYKATEIKKIKPSS